MKFAATSFLSTSYRFQYKVRRQLVRQVRQSRVSLALQAYSLLEKPQLHQARRKYRSLYENEQTPLVTVAIATYNRGQLLAERTLPAVQKQTYRNIEVVIVGDGCTDDTEARLKAINDPRIHFFNRPQRGKYPEDPRHRWQVAGTFPINDIYSRAKGSWIAHLDDDAIWEPDHLEVMLSQARQRQLELVYARGVLETSTGVWQRIGQDVSEYNQVGFFMPHSTWVFRSYLRLFRYSPDSWRLNLGTDLHITYRMFLAGVQVGFVDRVTYREPLRPATTSAGHKAEDRI